MIKYIFWDFDGTIADSLNLAIDITNKIALKNGIKTVEQEKINYYKSLSIFELIKEFNINLFQVPKLAIEFKKQMKKYIFELKPIPGLPEVIKQLSKNYKQGILTSNSLENVNLFLKNNKLSTYFSTIKSEPQILGKHGSLRKIIKNLKINKKEIIYIGDEYRDIIAANRVKILSIGVLWGFNSIEILTKAKPSFLVEKPQQIISIIKKINNESTNHSNWR